jgi:hypothetical protein
MRCRATYRGYEDAAAVSVRADRDADEKHFFFLKGGTYYEKDKDLT